MTASSSVRPSTAIADPDSPTHVLKPNADGSINISGTISANSSANATASAPTYIEGTENPLSQNLTGDLRVIAKQSGVWNVGGLGTAGSPLGGIISVQGVASMTPLLTTSTPVASTTLTASQVTVPATTNGILILAANASRKGATISNPSAVTVYIQQGATGVTTSNGFGIPAGASYNINSPLYTGAIYGIVAANTQVVTIVELT